MMVGRPGIFDLGEAWVLHALLSLWIKSDASNATISQKSLGGSELAVEAASRQASSHRNGNWRSTSNVSTEKSQLPRPTRWAGRPSAAPRHQSGCPAKREASSVGSKPQCTLGAVVASFASSRAARAVNKPRLEAGPGFCSPDAVLFNASPRRAHPKIPSRLQGIWRVPSFNCVVHEQPQAPLLRREKPLPRRRITYQGLPSHMLVQWCLPVRSALHPLLCPRRQPSGHDDAMEHAGGSAPWLLGGWRSGYGSFQSSRELVGGPLNLEQPAATQSRPRRSVCLTGH